MTLQIADARLSTQEEEDVGRAQSLWREKHPESLDSALMRSLLLVESFGFFKVDLSSFCFCV